MNDKDNKEYRRYPSDFMKDIFIELHLFDHPEKDEHSDFINIQMKLDLFRFAYDRISDVELMFMKRKEDYLKLK